MLQTLHLKVPLVTETKHSILKQTVEANPRKLTPWTFESSQDALAQHGIDVEAEIMNALAQEITAEIDREVIGSLNTLAGTAVETYDSKAVTVQQHLLVTSMQLRQFQPTEQLT